MKIVKYHSEEWMSLVSCSGNFSNPQYGWITWEVFELFGERYAKMIWTRL